MSARAFSGGHGLRIKLRKRRAPAEAFSAQLSRGMTSHMEEGHMALKTRQERFPENSKLLYLCITSSWLALPSLLNLCHLPYPFLPPFIILSINSNTILKPTSLLWITKPVNSSHQYTTDSPQLQRSSQDPPKQSASWLCQSPEQKEATDNLLGVFHITSTRNTEHNNQNACIEDPQLIENFLAGVSKCRFHLVQD